MKIEIAEQVRSFIQNSSPEVRKKLRAALRGLEQEKGRIKSLQGDLHGYHRLRVGSYRIIFRYLNTRNERLIKCDYAQHRSVVYEAFSQLSED